jgi:hypothetical protein
MLYYQLAVCHKHIWCSMILKSLEKVLVAKSTKVSFWFGFFWLFWYFKDKKWVLENIDLWVYFALCIFKIYQTLLLQFVVLFNFSNYA